MRSVRRPEFLRWELRASALNDGVGVVSAVVDGGVQRAMEQWGEAIADLV